MTGAGHRATALLSALVVFPLSQDHGLVAAAVCALSGSAPDWLELPRSTAGGGQCRLIPHRRITHWMLAWVALAALSWWQSYTLVGAILFGFAAGGLTHVTMDLPNPAGVPIVHPWRRSSLNWWRSGQADWLVAAGWGAVCMTTAKALT